MKSTRSMLLAVMLMCFTLSAFGLIEDFSSGVYRSTLWYYVDSDFQNEEKWIIDDVYYNSAPYSAKCYYNPTVAEGAKTFFLKGSVEIDTAGTLDFVHRQTCPAPSKLEVYVNGTIVYSYTGPTGGWTGPNPPIALAGGTNQIQFWYQTAPGNGGALWLDDVVITGMSTADAGTSPVYAASGKTVSLDGSGSTGLFYSWVQTAGSPTVLISNKTLSTASFIAPAVAAEETFTFELTVDNDPTDTVDVIVGGSPKADAGADQKADEGATVNLDGSNSAVLSVPWQTSLSYAWTVEAPLVPVIALTNADTATPSFTAPSLSAGETLNVVLLLTVENLYTGTATDTVVVTVYDSTVPVARAGADSTVALGTDLLIDGSGSDENGNPAFTYTWTAVSPDALDFMPLPQTGQSFTLNVSDYMGGYEYTFSLSLTNGDGYSDTDSITITSSTPPIADAGDDKNGTGSTGISLDGTGSYDPEGETLTYLWSQTGGTAVTWTTALTVVNPAFTVTVGAPQTLTFNLLVTDQDGFTDNDTVLVKVYDDDSPHAVAVCNTTRVVENTSGIQLYGSGSYDPQDGNYTFLTFSWTGAGITFSDANIANPTITVPDIGDNTAANYTITLTVTDTDLNTDTDTVIVRVYGDSYPHADAGSDITAYEGKSVTLNGTGSYDPDAGDTLTYSWALISGPSTFDFGAAVWNAVSPSFSVGSLDNNIVLVFELTVVSSGGSVADTDTVTVTLRKGGSSSGGGGGCSQSEAGKAVSLLPLLFAGLMLLIIRRSKN